MLKIGKLIKNLFKRKCRNKDKVHLNLDGLEILVERCFSYDKPHEVTVVVPRAELRKKTTKGEVTEEIEVILNSITVVLSPIRPAREGSGPPPAPPEIPREGISVTKKKHSNQEKRLPR